MFYNQKNGSLLAQKDYKKVGEENFTVVRETENTYNEEDLLTRKWIWGLQVFLNPYVNPIWVTGCNQYYRAKLFMYADIEQWNYVTSTTQRSYDENGESPIESVTSFEYEDTHYNLISTQTTNSDGTSQRTETAFAYSEDPAVFDANLLSENMTGVPLQVKQFYGGNLIGGARLKYNTVAANNGLLLPTDFYKYEYNPIPGSTSNWEWKGKLIYSAEGYPAELARPDYANNYIYNWVDGLLVARQYKDWTWEYNYTDDRLLKAMTDMDGQHSSYSYDRYRRLEVASSRGGNVQAKNTYHTGFSNNFIETQLIYSDADDQVSKKLFDGLGRARATIAIGHGVNNEDITTESYYYDNLGRQNLVNHYVTGNMVQEFEASPLGRVMKQKTFLESGEVTVKYHYYANEAADEVINYEGGGFYPPQTLYKAVKINENGHTSINFTDQLGRNVLSRKFVDGNAAANRVDTYTVYDSRGNVKEVITPGENGVAGPSYVYEYNAKNLLVKKTIPNAGNQLFTYDNRDRLSTSTDANGNEIVTDYDDYDRPIRTTLTGEGILSETFYDSYQGVNKSCSLGNTGAILNGKLTGSRVRTLEQDGLGSWLYTINCYDSYGRIINAITDNHLGGFDENQVLDIDHADQVKQTKRIHQSSNGNYEINQGFTYDHAFRPKSTTHQVIGGGLSSSGIVTLNQMNYNNKDQLEEKNLGGGLQSIDYRYNQKGWLTHINGISSSGGDPLNICPTPPVLGPCTTCLPPGGSIPGNPPNKPEKLINPTVKLAFNSVALNTGQATNIALTQNYTLVMGTDSVAVAVTQTLKIGKPIGPTIYTDTITKGLSNTSIQSTDINTPLSSLMNQFEQELKLVLTNPTMSTTVSDKMSASIAKKWNTEVPGTESADNDLFGMELKYDRGEQVLGSMPQYNGNISQIFWQVKDSEAKSYAFQYDELDRLKEAKYAIVRDDNYLSGDQFTVNNLNYDKRGNIKTLRRYGIDLNQSGTCYRRWQFDDLEYSFSGDQLASVTDKTTNSRKAEGYDGSGGFLYDANGNMTRDDNKGMTVEYNHLNLPKKFIFDTEDDTDKYIEILYDAAGIKLQKKVYREDNTTVKDYVAGIEYQDDQLEAIYHEEGRVVPTTEGFRYEYTLKDHLGNARVSFSDFNGNGVVDEKVFDPNNPEIYESEILQENHYYPFGMNMKGPWAPVVAPKNGYQYNGKELNEDFDLDWNDYGARWYQASIGRWHSVDPLAEQYATMSPYNYVANNPMVNIDPDGMRISRAEQRMLFGDGSGEEKKINSSGSNGNGALQIIDDATGETIDYTPEMEYKGSNSGIADKVEELNDLARIIRETGNPKIKIFIELNGIGHVYVQVGNEVYSYGRYNGSDSPSMGAFGPTGDGVLLKYEGQDAKDFIAERTAKNRTMSYKVSATFSTVQEHFRSLYASGTPNKTGGVVIDKYLLIGNNCVSNCVGGLNIGGANIPTFIVTPAGLNGYFSDLKSNMLYRD